jgi:hypothetical protein
MTILEFRMINIKPKKNKIAKINWLILERDISLESKKAI